MIITNKIGSNNNTVDSKAFVRASMKQAKRAKAIVTKAEAERRAQMLAYKNAVAGKQLKVGEIIKL